MVGAGIHIMTMGGGGVVNPAVNLITSGENGFTFGVENFTDNLDGTWTIETTNNTGGGMACKGVLSPVFEASSGKSYKVRYRLTGADPVPAIRVRSVLSATGNATFGALNIVDAVVDGAWHETTFVASGANDVYLQIGASTSGNFDLLVEAEAFEL